MHYDLLREPWIPVISLEGESMSMGIREILSRAHTLEGISDPSPMREYAVYRLLCALIMDALRPKDSKAIRRIAEAGRFDMVAFEDYFRLCASEGVSFDLFDEKRPFLQSDYDEHLDSGKEKSIAVLDFSAPSGNNHVHFDHTPSAEAAMAPDAAARSLCAVYCFCTAAAQGYPSGVNGAPPLFTLIHGDSLFETLVFSCLPVEFFNLPYDNPPVLWRRTEQIYPKKEVASTSLLGGMMFPARRLRLLPPDEDGMVRRVYFQQGENYVSYDAWTDPHVGYVTSDKGRLSLKPDISKEPWRNIAVLTACARGAPAVVEQYAAITHAQDVRLLVFGVQTNRAAYLGWQKGELRVQISILRDVVRNDTLKAAVSYTEAAAGKLRSAVLHLWAGDAAKEAVAARAVSDYYSASRQQLMGAFCEELSLCDTEAEGTLDALLEKWKTWVNKTALDCFMASSESMGSLAKLVIQSIKSELMLRHALKKMKEGE